jgi:RND family efflux transporter MFP subunit
MYAEEGQTVQAGALLARLDLAEIDSQVEQARAGFEKAERDLKRVERLYEDEVTTLEQLQDARTAFQIARSQLNAANFNLEHSSIRAPEAGRVLRRFVEEWELVGSGMPVYLFATGTQDWVVRVGVTDVDLLRLHLGDRAELGFDAHPDRRFTGRVTEIAETANPANGLFEVEIRLDPRDIRLVSGFIASVDILPSQRLRTIVVPVEALAEADGKAGSVFVVDEAQAKARKRSVRVAHIFDDRVALASGISDGQSVVVEGAEYLVDGSPVRVVAAAGD